MPFSLSLPDIHSTAESTYGEMLGNHDLYLKGPTPYEDLLRVGLIAKTPGVAPGQVVTEPVGMT
jgi:hypothetical protein